MIARRFVALGLTASAFFLALRLAASGTLPSPVAAPLLPALLVLLIAAAFQTRAALGGVDRSRPLLKRHGFWVVVVGIAIGLPALGTAGLVDPWETHYAEVAREMLERRDFISPWWANEGWFMSKPILTFWLEAVAMAAFGVHTGPDQVLGGGTAHPEWAIRFPGFAVALVGSYLLYGGVARTHGRRAGFIGAVVLWTMPGFALLTHQAMTDLPLVGCIAASIGLLLRTLSTEDAEPASNHLRYTVAGLIALVMFPQIAVLLGQHVHLDGGAIRLGADRLLAGSPHACTLPNQPACAVVAIAHPRLAPLVQAALFTPLSLWLVSHAAQETRAPRLFALLAWIFAALGAMAKGPVGLVIPGAAALVHLAARRSVRDLWRLEPIIGIVLAVVLIAPWYLAAYARHGRIFIDELVLRHMLGRTLDHLHDTNEGEDVGIVYFVRQLAYATFPWSGMAAIAVFGATRAFDRVRDRLGDRAMTRAVLYGATIASFALVSSMKTKFHHYVLIALPTIAMLTGIWIDETLKLTSKSARRAAESAGVGLALLTSGCVVAIVGRELASTSDRMRGPAGFILLLTYRYTRSWVSTTAFAGMLGAFAIAMTGLVLAGLWARVRTAAFVAFGAGAIALSAVLVDVYLPRCAADGGQRDVIAAFYKAREAEDQAPLVAYQLNWKGENFYTGNNVAIFITSGAPMKAYLARRRERGERTVFFVTERGRTSGLQRELGPVSSFEELTGPEVSSEFTLVRAVL